MLQSFLLEHVLLVNEHLLQINLMDSLVRVVHAQLFEAVVLEHLKAVDIEQFDGSCLLLDLVARVELPVELFDQPLEEALVDRLRHRISALGALPVAERTQYELPCNRPTMSHQRLQELLPVHPQQVSNTLSSFRILDLARLIFSINRELEVDVP